MQSPSEKLRRDYAARITRLAGVRDPRLESAFASVPREDFSGPPPWRVSGGLFGFSAGERDLAALYDDVLVAIDAAAGRQQRPAVASRPVPRRARRRGGRDRPAIGAGAGYYTAILAHLVGPSGKVSPTRSRPTSPSGRGKTSPAFRRSRCAPSSGVAEDLPKADAVYVNAAASHPVRGWLDALKPGGRLLFPLQAVNSSGAMLMVTRPEAESDAWPARLFSGVVFIACEGAQDAAIGRKLDSAFRRGGSERVRWLRLGPAPANNVWLAGEGWALTTQAGASA